MNRDAEMKELLEAVSRKINPNNQKACTTAAKAAETCIAPSEIHEAASGLLYLYAAAKALGDQKLMATARRLYTQSTGLDSNQEANHFEKVDAAIAESRTMQDVLARRQP